MDRRSVIKQAGLAGVLAAGAAPAIVQAQANLRWRLTSAFPKALDTIYGAAETFSKKVREMTGGKFEISVHANGELVPMPGLVDAVKNGTVEMGHTAPYYYFGKDETFALGCAIPFGLNSRQMTAWQYDGNGLKLMREFYRGYDIMSFPMGNTGAQMGGWFRKEIKTVQDYKGLKFTIDAAEWVGPYDDQKLGFQKVAKNYHYPGWWEGGPQLDLYINTKAYDSLSAEYKAIVENAAAFAHTEMQAKYDARNPGALKQLVSGGAKLVAFPKPVLDAAFKESMALYSELSAKNPNWKKVYDDYAKFRAEANLWFRFTEARFDTFMQSAKL
jgi:TRAP-type mannitol/chloroaromatic compound transport system substrate-binding protein